MAIKTYDKGILIEDIPDTPEQVAESAERAQIDNAISAIDSAINLNDIKNILKKLSLRLVKKGVLP